MTKVIIIQDDSLEKLYERTMDYLYTEYHLYPSNLKKQNVSVANNYKGYYERLADEIATNSNAGNGVPLGKMVV